MKTLKPQRISPNDFKDIAKQIDHVLWKIVFEPIVKLLAPHNEQVKVAAKELRNARQSTNPVVSGLLSGKIQYSKDTFSGDFNAAIGRELRKYGAQFNKRDRTYSVTADQLPLEVLQASKDYNEAARHLHEELEKRLKDLEKNLTSAVDEHEVDSYATISRMDGKFDSEYGDALGTEGMTQRSKDDLAKRYTNRLKPFIKKFSKEQIADLRAIVTENAQEGYRFDRLIGKIENRYGVSRSKAEFLARQETGLFTSQHRRARFSESGITHYIWRSAQDADVRDGHKHLNGNTYSYTMKAPAAFMSTGEPCNPGEDYNCRCVDEPIVETALVNA